MSRTVIAVTEDELGFRSTERSEGFSLVRASDLPTRQDRPRWLVQDLWGYQAVGLIGALPKTGKTFLGIELAVSIATGTPVFGTYAVTEPGPTLLYLAEDSEPEVRERLAGCCAAHGVAPLHPAHVPCPPCVPLVRGSRSPSASRHGVAWR